MNIATIKNLAFQFMGKLTDDGRTTIINKVGTNPLNHALFAVHLHDIGHAHDWLAYRDVMKKLFPS